MFKLSRKKIIIRTSIIGVLILSIVSLAGVFLLNKGETEVDAAGSSVSLSHGDSISYGEDYYTNKFSVDGHTAFCAQPSKHTPPSGSYAPVEITNNYVKLAIVLYVDQNSYTNAALNRIFEGSGVPGAERTDLTYAYIHASIGIFYDNDSYRNDKTYLADRIIAEYDNGNSDVWAIAKNYKLYMLNGGEGNQDIVWAESNYIHGNIKVQKCDIETGKCVSEGKRDLSGIKFNVYNNSGAKIYNNTNKTVYANGAVVASGLTDSNGIYTFSGLTRGTYSVEETASGSTNTRYALDGSRQSAAISTNGETKNLTFKNHLKRGDIKFVKVDKDNLDESGNPSPMSDTLFSISSLDENNQPKETHIVVSNAEGVVDTSSSFALHSNNTNGYDKPYDLDKAITFQGYGTWFGIDGDGGKIAVDDNVGALPYGEYLVQELRCASNIFCYEIKDQKKTVTVDKQLVDLGDWDNDCAEISLHTTATDAKDGDHYIEAGSKVTVKDHVSYCVREDLEYTLKGILMDKETGKPLTIDGKTFEQTAKIEPTDPCGEIDMTFELDASKLAGKDLVVYEYLYYKEGIVESHEDLDDEGQTVSVIELYTFAANKATGKKTVPLDQDVEIKDVVNYCLKPGQEYTVKGVLMNKSTKEAVQYNGKPVTSELTFTPEKTCGQVEMYYTMNTTGLAGAELVIFESLYITNETEGEEGEEGEKELTLILSHQDFNNYGETITVEIPAPETGLATAPNTGNTNTANPAFIVGVVVLGLGGYAVMRIVRRKGFGK